VGSRGNIAEDLVVATSRVFQGLDLELEILVSLLTRA